MKHLLLSHWTLRFIATTILLSAIFFCLLHVSIRDSAWGLYSLVCIAFPVLMMVSGRYHGSQTPTDSYDLQAKLYHLIAFLVVTVTQAAWAIVFLSLIHI